MKRVALLILVLIVLGKITGFLKELTLSYSYGIGDVTDSFFMANSISSLVYASLFLSIPALLIPIYTKVKAGGDVKMFVGIVKSTLTISLLISILVFSLSDILVEFFYSGVETTTSQMAGSYLKIISLSFMFSTLVALYNVIQVVEGDRLLSYIVPVVNNTIFIIGVLLFSTDLLDVLMLSLFGWLILAVVNSFYTKKYYTFNVSIKPSLDLLLDSRLRALFIPLVLLFTFEQVIGYITNYYGSLFGEGYISIINYASKINLVLISVFLILLNTYYFPKISNMELLGGGTLEFYCADIFRKIILCASMITLIICSCSDFIVDTLFLRGAFTEEDSLQVSGALEIIAVSLPFFLLRDFLNRILFSLSGNKYTLFSLGFALIFHFIMSFVLSQYFGFLGVLISLVASSFINSFILVLYLFFKYKFNVVRGFIAADLSFVAILIALSYYFFTSQINLYVGVGGCITAIALVVQLAFKKELLKLQRIFDKI
jgi:putative peptidoglycan lipid II flippase